MKTNVVMTRKMGNFDIFQRTEDGMFNATSLLSQWNKKRGLSRGKEVNDFLKIDKTKEFIAEVELRENHNTNKIVLSKKGNDALIEDENLNTGNPVFKTHTVIQIKT